MLYLICQYVEMLNFVSRVGVIIEHPQNCLFQDRHDVIITSGMAIISEIANDDDEDVQMLENFFYRFGQCVGRCMAWCMCTCLGRA